MIKRFIIACLIAGTNMTLASDADVHLEKAPVDITDIASLQRGAKYFMNICLGCHSMGFARYSRIAKDLNIKEPTGQIDKSLFVENLIFTGGDLNSMVKNALPEKHARSWFGVVPPDLTLVARVRGANWLYSYLLGFYKDDSRPWGVNNTVFKDVGMPNVLEPYQGIQVPFYKKGHPGQKKEVDFVKIYEEGSMGTRQFESMVGDIVNFLVYVAEPNQSERKSLGLWVLLFLSVLLVFVYLLKKEFWKDIK